MEAVMSNNTFNFDTTEVISKILGIDYAEAKEIRHFRHFRHTPDLNSDPKINNLTLAKTANLANFEESIDLTQANLFGIPITELQNFAGDEWQLISNDRNQLEAFAHALYTMKQKERGEIPANYTATANCANCGDVYLPPELVLSGKVEGCPWCWNKANDLPIPMSNINT